MDNQCAPFAICTPKNHEARCACPPGRSGDPYKSCLVIGCRENSQCPSEHMCLNEECKDVCAYNNTCGVGAVCSGENNNVKCSCPEGQRGDPMVACLRTPDRTCTYDFDCLEGLVCMNGLCADPCKEIGPCPPVQECSVIDSSQVRTMVCSCPDLMVVSKIEICKKRKHN